VEKKKYSYWDKYSEKRFYCSAHSIKQAGILFYRQIKKGYLDIVVHIELDQIKIEK